MLLGLVCMIIIGLLSAFFNIFIMEKTNMAQKIKKFDDENSGPVYDFIKNLSCIILLLGCFACSFAPMCIPNYIANSMYSDALMCFIIPFLAGFVMYIVLTFMGE
jgi:hypothetical protein